MLLTFHTIPRCIKLQQIKGIANILADSVSRLKAAGLYHDLDLQKNQPDFGTPFEPLPPVEEAMHASIVVHEISIKTMYKPQKNRSQTHKQNTPTYPLKT